MVLQGILSRKDVAPFWPEKAACIVVLTDGGRGMMSCRTGHSGPWSAPALYIASRVNGSLQYGGSSLDNGVDGCVDGKTKVGSHASVALRVASANSKWGCDTFARCGK